MSTVQRCFVICLFFLTTLSYSPQLLDYYHHSRFAVAAFFLTIFAGILLFQSKSTQRSFTMLDGAVLILLIWSFLSLIWADNRAEAIFYSQKYLLLLSTYSFTIYLMSDVRDQFSLFLHIMSRILTIIILGFVTSQLVDIVGKNGFSNDALYGLNTMFGHKSLISAYLFMLLPLNLLHLKPSDRWFNLSLLLVLLQILMIVVLQSRTVYLALFAFLGIMGYHLFDQRRSLSKKNIQILVGSILAGTVIALLFLSQQADLRTRLNPATYLSSQTASERRLVWYKTKQLIAQEPFLGVGSGNWKMQFPRNSVEGSYRMQDQDVIFTRAHNDFLEIMAELGIVGILSYILIFCTAVYHLFKSGFSPWHRRLLLSALVGFLFISLLDFPKERIEFLIILGIYLALIRIYSVSSIYLPIKKGRGLSYKVALGLLLLWTSFVGWYRYSGERHAVKMLAAQIKQDWPEVLKQSRLADNRWHTLDPSAVPLGFYEGIAQYHLKHRENALDAFKRAQENHPFHFHVINNIGTILVEETKYMDALEYFEEAIRINPHFEDAVFNRAFCLANLGRVDEALDQMDSIVTDSDKKETFIRELTKLKESN